MEITPRSFATNFGFPEGPRWKDGSLWFSDMVLSRVYRLSESGEVLDSFEVPGSPSGLGWLPTGDLLVVSMAECQLYLQQGGQLFPTANLRAIHNAYSNDMVVDSQGRAYIGALGFDFTNGESPRPTAIAMVTRDGEVSCAAAGLNCPNGMVISADGRTLVVAETNICRLSAFDIDNSGALSNYRIFADLGEYSPDGICIDAEGGIWVATTTPAVIRVTEGGTITDKFIIEGANAYACMLGGRDGKDLFICCAPEFDPVNGPTLRRGRIDVARVSIPHGGLP